jgi:competence protein ComEA
MKQWQSILLGFLLGIAITAVIYLLAIPPRGTPIMLMNTNTPSPIIIDISGEVKNPGLVQLTSNHRIADAIDAAGGALHSADLSKINLAAEIFDGEKLYIPGSQNSPTKIAEGNLPAGIITTRLDINTATLSDFDQLPGIGPAKAQAIIDYRKENGMFDTLEDLLNVPGVGVSLLNQIKDYITIR